jgi:hypothetical protein
MPLTIKNYYLGFYTFVGALAGIPFLAPILHAVIPPSILFPQYLYPPLGDIEWLGIIATIALLLTTTYLTFLYCESRKTSSKSIGILMAGLILLFCCFIGLHVAFVKQVSIPAEKTEMLVSVGYQPTDFSIQTYPRWTAFEILQDVGTGEDEIQKLWTVRSLYVVRIFLWLAYTLTVCCFLGIVSIAVYRYAEETAAAAVTTSSKP